MFYVSFSFYLTKLSFVFLFFLQPYIFLELFTFSKILDVVSTSGLFFHGFSSSYLLIHGMTNFSQLHDSERGSVYLSFGLLERSSAHLTGGRLVVFAISLCALLHFPFLLNDSRNLVEHGELWYAVICGRRCRWERGSMNTELFERKWGSHFNNVLPTTRREYAK